MTPFKLLFCVCFVHASVLTGQPTNFRENLQKADPLAQATDLPFEEKEKKHRTYLEEATRNGDSEKRLFGFLFLFKDYMQAENYPEATRCLLEAEALAKTVDRPGWLGAVRHRQGILSIYLKDYRKAIPYYKEAVSLCGQAHDSLCVAESLEQLSSMYGRTGDYPQAYQYFNLAIPLLERYGGDVQMSTALNNFANLLALQERPAEAIPYFERALTISRKMNDPRRETQYLSNMADSYCQLGLFKQAFAAYHRCIDINRKNNWTENLVFNYQGIAVVYETTGDFSAALEYYKQFHHLRDSLLGAETQEKIADLQVRYDTQGRTIALQKQQAELEATRRSLEQRTTFIALTLCLGAFGLWRWRAQMQSARRNSLQHQTTLHDLTRLLLDKNTQLIALQEQTAARSADEVPVAPTDFETNLYKQRILTDADWFAFKIYFEKAYPGYQLRLRQAVPALSDAEERLFLFIKLNLNRREAAAILGITPDSVKKTRNRLRKRLGLSDEEDLDAYVRAF